MTPLPDDLVVRPYRVEVPHFGSFLYVAGSRGKALAKAFGDWRSLRDEADFKDFLRLAKAKRDDCEGRFGEAITVGGQAAYYVSHDRQYVQFVRPNSDVVLHSHPLDVEPPHARWGTPYHSEEPSLC